MTKFAQPLVSALFVLISLAAAASCGKQKASPMDKTGWKTHCIGRFLVDLPPQARVNPTYKIWGEEIKRLSGETPDSLATRIDKREQELKARRHETEGSMFIRRVEHGNGSLSLLSWSRPYNKILMRMDSYLVTSGNWRAFQYSAPIDPDSQQPAIGLAENLSKDARSREPADIPKDPGYCVDGGFIAGSELRAESFDVEVVLPAHHGVSITLTAMTQAELDSDTLLDRAAEVERDLHAHGGKTLRKRQRDVGPIRAQEFLAVNDEEGQRIYAFAWESPGKVDSLAEPHLRAELNAFGQSVVDEDHPYQPPFKSDEEAIDLWDAIIESIRQRPGAV